MPTHTQDAISHFTTQAFSISRFKSFIQEVFGQNRGIELRNEDFRDTQSQCQHIKSAYRLLDSPLVLENPLGGGDTLEFYVFEVKSIKAKIGLHQDLKICLNNTGSSAILACFYESHSCKTFRLTLINYTIKGGKVDYSHPKRQSFVLGEGENTRSAQEQLGKLASAKTLQEIENAFALEPLNKEFFEKILECFGEFAENLTFPTPQDETKTRQFVLRLMSRILFCKFLEKRGAIPSEIWDTSLSNDYYHDVLEPLFFLTLNTPKDRREDSLLDEGIVKLLASIPYLNGGLFAPQNEDFFALSYRNTLKIPNQTFEKFFEILETFHFTVDESTPLDCEIGLDPEMLGMVFENLLSVLFTDNKIDNLHSLRKKTGSYYTPREIVSYMVKSSLLEYLKTFTKINEAILQDLVWHYDKTSLAYEQIHFIMSALHQFKVLDPACGSGAFPIGMLQEMCAILEALDPKAEVFFTLQNEEFKHKYTDKDPSYIRKLSLLQNNIYGVDIQPMAIEIARLRCFLSLICDESQSIDPLPNLEFKFVCANALLPISIESLSILYHHYDQDRKHLQEIRQRSFENNTFASKEKIKEEFFKTRNKIAQESILSGFQEGSILSEWDPYDPQSIAGFFDAEFMFGIKEFDCVIGNPPYVQVSKKLFPISYYPYSEGRDQGKQNLYKVFVEYAYNITKQTGIVCLITQSSIMCDLSASYTRNLLLTKTKLLKIIEFPKKAPNKRAQIFKSALQGTCILIFEKSIPSQSHQFCLSISNDKTTINHLVAEKIQQNEILKLYPKRFEIPLITKGEMSIIQKIKEDKKLLGEMLEKTLQGNINTTKLKEIQSEEKTNILIVKGENCHRYFMDPISMYGNANNSLIQKSLENNSNYYIITTQNITGTTDANRIHANLIESKNTNFVFLDSVNISYSQNLKESKLMIGLLNSQLLDWLFRKTSTNNHCNKYELEDLPIPQIDSNNQKTADEIVKCVQEILECKAKDPRSNTKTLESHIDSLVYTLYHLTEEEIAIIEGEQVQSIDN